ncbi:hypothetical protein [Zoogloea sp.]|uniref:hypothetical protein n=1 Tax=Zoogloea sp. TaxID=49181 RepID=UPI0026213BB8|nr:hypothetical protein [Zoogloea sp.]MDD3352414.1 hypothetical protein [Zoogloea sp.]
MKEGSAFLLALLLAVGIAYWSDHYRIKVEHRPDAPVTRVPSPGPYEETARGFTPEPPPPAERLYLATDLDGAARAVLCEELLEVVRGADAALQLPQSASTTEQLINRRRLYQEKRAVLGC